ncbi:MAG: hypothetical protein HZC51_13845 [Nitrospirae bacterium]|nr:hypothetical protein [Nitrospirota bacterium]
MSSRIFEFFGYSPADETDVAREARRNMQCPFLWSTCVKTLNDGSISGVCTLKPKTSKPVICCPYRLYANNYAVLSDVARESFGKEVALFPANIVRTEDAPSGASKIAVFGKKWGKELRLPNRGKSGGYYVDWVLARLDNNGNLEEFVAAEVQSIDTTGNYQEERRAHLNRQDFSGWSTAGLNWENVNKRILPQLIYKGHVLRRERMCGKGLFFICPAPVYEKIRERLGGNMYEYALQPGALTLMWYDIDTEESHGKIRELRRGGKFTTTVDQVALAFTSPSNLPDENVYEAAIRAELNK